MPKITADRLVGYELNIARVQQPVSQNGHAIHDAKGTPKLRTMYELTFFDPSTGHRILVALDESAKDELVAAFTGGLVIPT